MVSLLIRVGTLHLTEISTLSVLIVALIVGAVFAAFFGAALASRLSEE